jgi:uncharacterized repeat protein (TIGR03803 family)
LNKSTFFRRHAEILRCGIRKRHNEKRRKRFKEQAMKISQVRLQPAITGRTLAAALVMILSTYAAQAQFSVIHSFAGSDGRYPYSGLTIDRNGNLYGTTELGGANDRGVVFELTSSGSGWTLTPLYSFQTGNDGGYPYAGVTIGPDGALYGTTTGGGGSECANGCGTVYRLTPPALACKTALCPWNETVLYRFTGAADGQYPCSGVIFDQAGNLYGTAIQGGATGNGVVYELARTQGGWTQSVLYTFSGAADGGTPFSHVTFDSAGNLYGNTIEGGAYGEGTVYELMPSGSGWIETVLYSFTGGMDGSSPYGGVIFDALGNLYGNAATGGASPNSGTAFELSPAGGSWTFTLLYGYSSLGEGGINPHDAPIMDASGNLYGTLDSGGIPPANDGTVYELTPSNAGWTYTSFHNFAGGADGLDPFGSLVFDASGNLYGTASFGGANGGGVVFEVTP